MLFQKALITTVSAMILIGTVPAEAADHPRTGEPLAEVQTFAYQVIELPRSLDPHKVDRVVGQDIARDLFEGLFNQDRFGALTPGVAVAYESNADKTVFTFVLRDDAEWSDGTPVTANDFVYAWRRASDPTTESPYSWFMELTLIENVAAVVAGEKPPETLGVQALDDQTLEVRLSKSMSYFPTLTTHTEMFPVPRWTIENLGEEWTQPGAIVSNGAYRLGENTSERIVRFRSPSYWDNDNTIINKVIAHIVDTQKAVELYNAGEMDRFDIPPGEYPALHARFPDLAISFPRLCVYYFSFNLSDSGPPALKDINVRRALALAIDRDVITDTVLQGGQTPAYTFTPPTTANFSAPPGTYGQMSQEERTALAKRLIAEAGYGPNSPLTLTVLFNTSAAHRNIATQIARMWKEQLGVTAELSEMKWRDFLDVRGKQAFEVARGGWCGDFNDPATFLELMTSNSGYNDGKFINTSVDALLDAARKTDDRVALYTGIEQILAEEMPVIPLYHYSGVYMFSQHLKNWPTENATQTWYSKDLYKVP